MIKTVAASALALAMFATSAAALSVTNKSSKEHKIGIDLGATERVETIAAGKALKVDDCKDGCGFTGPWGYSWMAKTGEDFTFDDKGLTPAGS
jgi:hypothetical protein